MPRAYDQCRDHVEGTGRGLGHELGETLSERLPPIVYAEECPELEQGARLDLHLPVSPGRSWCPVMRRTRGTRIAIEVTERTWPDLQLTANFPSSGKCLGDTPWDRVERQGPAVIVEAYLIVSCGLSPVVEVVNAIQEKDISRVDSKRPASLGCSTQAPIDLAFWPKKPRPDYRGAPRELRRARPRSRLAGRIGKICS